MQASKERKMDGGRRRSRAIRKLLRLDGMDNNVRLIALMIIDFLNGQSGYEVAWPSVRRLAKRLGVAERTATRYVQTVKSLGIFDVKQLSPSRASEFLQQRYGLNVSFSQCRHQAPNIYVVCLDHPLWSEKDNLDAATAKTLIARSQGMAD